MALNKEIIDNPDVKEEFKDYHFEESKGSEVGNIFKLGTKFTKPFDVNFTDKNGESNEILMGCYGIGVSRIMGIIAEKMKDEKGLVWPENVAPYNVYVVVIGDEKINEEALSLVDSLEKRGISVIYDDRPISPGMKLKDSELLGIPARIVISEKSLASGGYEYQKRSTGEKMILGKESIIKLWV